MIKMTSSKRGSITIELIVVIVLALIGSAVFGYVTISQSETFYGDLVTLNNYVGEIIVDIETEGYISERIMFDIKEFADQLSFSTVDITGTTGKVNKGEEILLRIDVTTRNLRGGTLRHDKVSVRGIAK